MSAASLILIAMAATNQTPADEPAIVVNGERPIVRQGLWQVDIGIIRTRQSRGKVGRSHRICLPLTDLEKNFETLIRADAEAKLTICRPMTITWRGNAFRTEQICKSDTSITETISGKMTGDRLKATITYEVTKMGRGGTGRFDKPFSARRLGECTG